MRYANLLPTLAACVALLFLAASADRTVGQGGTTVRITDEDSAGAEPGTTITVQPAPTAAPTPAPAPAPVAVPAAPGAVGLPTNAADINRLIGDTARLETQADEILANQQKIDAQIAELADIIREARIYASRAGRNNAAP